MKQLLIKLGSQPSELGGAAIEYVLVTTFATLASLMALTFVGKLVKEKLENVAEKLGIEVNDIDLDVPGFGRN